MEAAMTIRLQQMSFAECMAVLRERRERLAADKSMRSIAFVLLRPIGRAKARVRLFHSRVRRAVHRNLDRVREHLAPLKEFTSAVQAGDVLTTSVRKLKSHLVMVALFSAAINLLYLAPSLYMMQVYDRVLPTNGLLTLLLLSVVLLAALSVMGALDALRGRLLGRASLRLERLALEPLMQQVFAARRANPGEPGAVGVRDLDNMRTGLSSPAMIGLLDIPWTPLFIFVCFVIHFWIGMFALAGAVVIFSIAILNERASRAGLKAVTQRAGAFYAAHEADLSMAETVHALGAQHALTQRRVATRADLVDAQTQAAFDNAGFSALTKGVRMVLQSAALCLGCYLAVERQMSPGAIIAATILTARAFAPVEQIVSGWRQLGTGWAAFVSLREAFAKAAQQMERTPLPAPQGRVGVEYASAAAPGSRTLALHGVSFTSGPAEIVGIIGPSGAGKTTLARLLANAAPPQNGAVRIDSARYADWDQRALARHIGYLPQRIDLLDGTIAENISRFARMEGEAPDVVGAKVVEAAQMAGAHELILNLPDGYETRLGFSGAGVSPGQAQRIALARAMYGTPRVLVLDEPNSHLDSEGDSALIQALVELRARGSVIFVVAHRAGVLAIADKIAVLSAGRLVDYGPRAEVVAKLTTAAANVAQIKSARVERVGLPS
jgi:PrtD family type I secretion system ABC transporter